MAIISDARTGLNGGEISPLLYGQVGLDKFARMAELCRNYVPLVQGPITRRPGTYYVQGAKFADKQCRLVPFVYSTGQACVFEMGEYYIRVYQDHALVASTSPWDAAFSSAFGGFFEITTPYDETETQELSVKASGDTLYIAHEDFAPRKLVRTSDYVWSLDTINFLDGPYLSPNTVSGATLTPSATTGSITITANAAAQAEINNGDGWKSTDVGRMVRMSHVVGGVTSTGWAKITAYTSATVVQALVYDDFSANSATRLWRLGVWSDTTGYPGVVGAFQDRVIWAASTSYPQRFDTSISGDAEVMWPYDPNGVSQSPLDGDSVSSTIIGASKLLWLQEMERGVVVGTANGVFVIRSASAGGVLTPSTAQAVRVTTHAANTITPTLVGGSLLYVHGTGKRIVGFAYQLANDGFVAENISLVGEHLAREGVLGLAFQSYPHNVVWMASADGKLLGLSLDPTQEMSAWHQHVLGGSFGAGSSVVESVAVVPASGGATEELWLVVKRTIAGQTVRHIEYLTDFFGGVDDIEDSIFLDSALTYSGGAVSSLGGLSHLEGETVKVLTNGSVHTDCVVSSGAITLNRTTTKAHVGLGYSSEYLTTRVEHTTNTGSAQVRHKRIKNLTLRLQYAGPVLVGADADHVSTVPYRNLSAPLGSPPPLFSGDVQVQWAGQAAADARIYVRQEAPLPGYVCGLFPFIDVSERA